MLRDFASASGQEVWNLARLQAYLTNIGSPFDTGPAICTCGNLTPAMLGDDELVAYDTPATDPAPWYDPDFALSGQFLGFMPLSLEGVDDNPRRRSVTNAVGGGGVFGPSRVQPRNITVRGVLIGTSCCGVDYGLHYLTEALSAGCTGESCDGDCFEMLACCPEDGQTPAQYRAASVRTFRRTALVSGPDVIRRVGTATCSGGCQGGDLVEVEFVLTAATPWAWTDPLPLLDVPLPVADPEACIEWVVDGTDCLFADCFDVTAACADPRNPVPQPPVPSIPSTSFCMPLEPETACYTVDLSDRPQWSDDVPIITVTAGSAELRNIRVTMYERPEGTLLTCEEIAEANRCTPLNDFIITYVPPGGSVTIDGQVGRATTECGGECVSATSVFGDPDGGPVRINDMSCASYCVCITSDGMYPPAADAELSLSISGRGL